MKILKYLKLVSIIIIVILIIIIIFNYFNHKRVFTPILIKKTVDSKNELKFEADRLQLSPINGGVKFAFSFWIYINSWNYKYGLDKIILYWKGDSNSGESLAEKCKKIEDPDFYASDSSNQEARNKRGREPKKCGGNICNKKPLLYEDFSNYNNSHSGVKVLLAKKKNNLIINIGLINNNSHRLVVKKIPIQKWLNIIINLNLRNLDIFINGKLESSKKLETLPAYHQGALYVTPYGGFDGYMSRFQYFNRNLLINEIKHKFNQGPQTMNVVSNETDAIANKLLDTGNQIAKFKTVLKHNNKYFNDSCVRNAECISNLECVDNRCQFQENTIKIGNNCFKDSDCVDGLNCNNQGPDELSYNQHNEIKNKGLKISESDKYNRIFGKPFECYKTNIQR